MIYVTSINVDGNDNIVLHKVESGMMPWAYRWVPLASVDELSAKNIAVVNTACEVETGEHLPFRNDDFSDDIIEHDDRCDLCFYNEE